MSAERREDSWPFEILAREHENALRGSFEADMSSQPMPGSEIDHQEVLAYLAQEHKGVAGILTLMLAATGSALALEALHDSPAYASSPTIDNGSLYQDGYSAHFQAKAAIFHEQAQREHGLNTTGVIGDTATLTSGIKSWEQVITGQAFLKEYPEFLDFAEITKLSPQGNSYTEVNLPDFSDGPPINPRDLRRGEIIQPDKILEVGAAIRPDASAINIFALLRPMSTDAPEMIWLTNSGRNLRYASMTEDGTIYYIEQVPSDTTFLLTKIHARTPPYTDGQDQVVVADILRTYNYTSTFRLVEDPTNGALVSHSIKKVDNRNQRVLSIWAKPTNNECAEALCLIDEIVDREGRDIFWPAPLENGAGYLVTLKTTDGYVPAIVTRDKQILPLEISPQPNPFLTSSTQHGLLRLGSEEFDAQGKTGFPAGDITSSINRLVGNRLERIPQFDTRDFAICFTGANAARNELYFTLVRVAGDPNNPTYHAIIVGTAHLDSLRLDGTVYSITNALISLTTCKKPAQSRPVATSTPGVRPTEASTATLTPTVTASRTITPPPSLPPATPIPPESPTMASPTITEQPSPSATIRKVFIPQLMIGFVQSVMEKIRR